MCMLVCACVCLAVDSSFFPDFLILSLSLILTCFPYLQRVLRRHARPFKLESKHSITWSQMGMFVPATKLQHFLPAASAQQKDRVSIQCKTVTYLYACVYVLVFKRKCGDRQTECAMLFLLKAKLLLKACFSLQQDKLLWFVLGNCIQ